MTDYETKTAAAVTAIQRTATNAADIKAAWPGAVVDDTKESVVTQRGRNPAVMRPGDWLVYVGTDWFVVNNTVFAALFQTPA